MNRGELVEKVAAEANSSKVEAGEHGNAIPPVIESGLKDGIPRLSADHALKKSIS